MEEEEEEEEEEEDYIYISCAFIGLDNKQDARYIHKNSPGSYLHVAYPLISERNYPASRISNIFVYYVYHSVIFIEQIFHLFEVRNVRNVATSISYQVEECVTKHKVDKERMHEVKLWLLIWA
jgi:hypothetical protein